MASLVALVALSLVSVAAVVALSRVRVLEEQRLTTGWSTSRLWSPALGGRTTVRLLLPTAYADRPERPLAVGLPAARLLRQLPQLDPVHRRRGAERDERGAGGDAGRRPGRLLLRLAGRARLGDVPHGRAAGPAGRRYRASDRRSIAGTSMGGLGALGYAARHPGAFVAAASFSGIVHTRQSTDESRAYLGLLRDQGEHPYRLWGAPNVDADRWAAHNPYDLAPRLTDDPAVHLGGRRPARTAEPRRADDPIEPSLLAENEALARAPDLAGRTGRRSTSTARDPTTGPTGSGSCTAPGRCSFLSSSRTRRALPAGAAVTLRERKERPSLILPPDTSGALLRCSKSEAT